MRRIAKLKRILSRWIAAPLLFLIAGCAENGRSGESTTASSTRAPAEASADRVADESTATPATPTPQSPRRPVESWTIFRAAFDDKADANMTSRWTGGNRLEVSTDNIQRITVDLNKLPADAPQKGPWVLQIDEQGIQITGFRGKVVELVRSTNGQWRVDKDAMPKRR